MEREKEKSEGEVVVVEDWMMEVKGWLNMVVGTFAIIVCLCWLVL